MKQKLTTILLSLGLFQAATAQQLQTGPSTTTSPYLWPSVPTNTIKSVLTVGDVVGTYTMVGLPDGLGVIENGGSTFTLVMNHEMGNTSGAIHAHGQTGAFVSKWVINKSNLQVVSGDDLIQDVMLWTGTTYSLYNSTNPSTLTAFTRFCSADLPEISAFYNSASGKGTQERIFMNGEESGTEGRAFAHIVTGAEAGKTYQLPYLGRFSWENSVTSPYPQDKTIVIGMDDATPGQVYVYVGQKSVSGTTIEKAGLHGGQLYGISVNGFLNEQSSGFPSYPAANTPFTLVSLGSGVQNQTGATLNTNSNNLGITSFLRPEDGAWDPNRPSDFYFVTTNAFTAPSRMWRIRFNDIKNPELGGTITAVLEGTEGHKMADNITMDNHGHVFIQEDVGGNNHLGKIWQYKIATDQMSLVATHDSTRFQTGGANFLTIDEEASGMIDMQGSLGAGWFIFSDQAHYAKANPLVEGGQLLAFYNSATGAANPEINLTGNGTGIPDGKTTTGTADFTDFGAANLGTSITRTFVINNTNSGTLIVSGYNMSGNNAGDFTIQGPVTPFVLNGNSSQTLYVTFSAPVLGARQATLNVISSDFDEKYYDFALKGTGASPEIAIDGNNVSIVSGNTVVSIGDNTDFGSIIYNNTISKIFRVQNTGTGTLTLSGISITGAGASMFTILNAPPFPTGILASGSQTFEIQYQPMVAASHSVKITVMNNDADEANYSYIVSGKGLADVGIREISENSTALIFMPNPANDKVYIGLDLQTDAQVNVSVTDILGKEVVNFEKPLNKGENSVQLNTASYKSGLYFVTINAGGKTQTAKLVIEH